MCACIFSLFCFVLILSSFFPFTWGHGMKGNCCVHLCSATIWFLWQPLQNDVLWMAFHEMWGDYSLFLDWLMFLLAIAVKGSVPCSNKSTLLVFILWLCCISSTCHRKYFASFRVHRKLVSFVQQCAFICVLF